MPQPPHLRGTNGPGHQSPRRRSRVITDRAARFVDEYLVDFAPRQAAIRAGYSPLGAGPSAKKLLQDDRIQDKIDKRLAEQSRRTGVTADRVVRELARIGFSDPRQVFDTAGHLLPIHLLDDDTAATIQSIEVVTRPGGEVDEEGRRQVEFVHKIRFWDKSSAIEKLAKHTGVIRDKVEVTGEDGGDLRIVQRLEFDGLSPDERAALRAILERRAREPEGGAEGS